MSPRYAIEAKTASQLAQMVTPASGTDLEALPWILFDTNTASFANGATSLDAVFFTSVNTDKTLCNLEASAQLPIPQVLEVAGMTCDILAIPDAAAAGPAYGPISDIASILKTVRSVVKFTLSNKTYGIFPLTAYHATGGETGMLFGTAAAGSGGSYGNNGIFDGGWWVDGAIVIPSQQTFIFEIITSSTALALTQTPMPVRAGIWGPIHRRVL
jgi:hypothetical protein